MQPWTDLGGVGQRGGERIGHDKCARALDFEREER